MNLVIKHDIFIFVMARSLLGKCMWKYSMRIEKSFQLSLKFLLMLHCFIFIFFFVFCACDGKILLVFLCFQVHHGGAGTTAAGLRAAVILMAIF